MNAVFFFKESYYFLENIVLPLSPSLQSLLPYKWLNFISLDFSLSCKIIKSTLRGLLRRLNELKYGKGF